MVIDDAASRAARKKFADAYRKARASAGLTQLQAAVEAGVTPNHISAIENSRHDPRLSTMVHLAASVGKTLEVRLVDPSPSRKRKI
jgi:transcriptional regulator with XRE-family HTH domain